MGNYYNLPVYINVGLSDSKIPDAQGGMEAGITLVCGAMAGADIFGHLGISGADQGTLLSMLMMQHEIIGYVERIMQGVEVTDEKLGLDVIESGIKEGSFFAEEHTVRNFREELWFPDLLDRNFWENWYNAGKKDMMNRCKEKLDQIFKEHRTTPLDDSTLKDMDKLLKDARKHLSKE
jgi:trimethylamine--corrinoid protein Co-methyltransferase